MLQALGQMYRLDSRGTVNYSGFATTTSWLAWNAPTDVKTSSSSTWYQFGIAINAAGTSSTLYYDAGTGTNPVTGTVWALMPLQIQALILDWLGMLPAILYIPIGIISLHANM